MIARTERFGYAAGDLGFNLVWQSIELYLLFFYVEILDLPLGVAAGIFLLGAMVDWIADPLIGVAVDRSADRFPLRLWILLSGPLVGTALALAFLQPPFDGGALIAYAALTHILLRFAYSCGNIPYAALTARMTDDPAEHVRLTSIRMQGAALGGLVAALIYAVEPANDAGSGHRFLTGALILGLLAQPCFFTTWRLVRERVATVGSSRHLSPASEFRAYFALFRESAALRRLLATILVAGLSTTATFKSILFLYKHDLQAGAWGYWAALLPSVALLVTAPMWSAFSQRLGRGGTLMVAAAIHWGALLAIPLVPEQGIGMVTLLLGIAIAASCGMSVMFWSLVPAAIEDLECNAATAPCAARVYALSTTTRKLGQALAPQLIALSLVVTDADGTGGSTVPAIIVAATLCLATVMLYRPTTRRHDTDHVVGA
ncbi:MFS transporter [Sphingomonas sp. LaA6.9]|uniref:MFS transporter n=1 Tax=Sphingomonas sp. LaA6.9 TaxID=2919914 RepID=UPI001F5005CE|nr:MFS transporter [Sphingomonas sp. LaA6.9]MCJ8157924.1 MFS transporter [Sphingomonas sp. LaA6.9]